jgi:hypothetical protein
MFIHNLLNVLVQIPNKIGLQKKIIKGDNEKTCGLCAPTIESASNQQYLLINLLTRHTAAAQCKRGYRRLSDINAQVQSLICCTEHGLKEALYILYEYIHS